MPGGEDPAATDHESLEPVHLVVRGVLGKACREGTSVQCTLSSRWELIAEDGWWLPGSYRRRVHRWPMLRW